ncbi:MAG: amidohydrolase family protein [Clostridia bacterium]|nr:amidohydrolase family protein [Clostridia bacterium]
MVIDFHTHAFPEKIAAGALADLAKTAKMDPCHNGCIEGLLGSMKRCGVNIGVMLPVITSVKQFDSIIRFANNINKTPAEDPDCKLIAFGGAHPDDENYEEHLKFLASERFKGIKIHPAYQHTDFNDIKYKRIIGTASELGLIVITHAGPDPYDPSYDYCSPDMILDVLKDVTPEKLVLAHMGSCFNYDESEEKLCGQNVFIDTAHSLRHIEKDQFVRMVRKHGADRILFATDSPWGDQLEFINFVKNSGLTEDEQQLIFSENAKKLLKI